MRKLCEGIPPNTDDRSIPKYEAPKNLWNAGNPPNLYFEISHWFNAFEELWGRVDLDNKGTLNREELKEIYIGERRRTLELVARSLGMWCLYLEQRGKLNQALAQYERMFSLFPKTLNPVLLDY